jgi:hypothetical protein
MRLDSQSPRPGTPRGVPPSEAADIMDLRSESYIAKQLSPDRMHSPGLPPPREQVQFEWLDASGGPGCSISTGGKRNCRAAPDRDSTGSLRWCAFACDLLSTCHPLPRCHRGRCQTTDRLVLHRRPHSSQQSACDGGNAYSCQCRAESA